jgi:hypothetical protein
MEGNSQLEPNGNQRHEPDVPEPDLPEWSMAEKPTGVSNDSNDRGIAEHSGLAFLRRFRPMNLYQIDPRVFEALHLRPFET